MNLLVNETMQKAQPVSELGTVMFPECRDRDLPTRPSRRWSRSAVRPGGHRDEAGLLPCRVHAFFRGLPGLWACLDPECDAVDRGRTAARPRPDRQALRPATGDLRLWCAGLRVLHLPPLRLGLRARLHRRSAGPVVPVARAGRRVPHDVGLDPGTVRPRPAPRGALGRTGRGRRARPRDRPPEPRRSLRRRGRVVFLPKLRSGETVTSDDDDDDGDDQAEANGEFKPCGVCGQLAGFGRSSVQDHQTKGDQPFQALVTRQIEVQPPSAPYSDLRAAARPQGAGLLRLAAGGCPARPEPPGLLDARRHPPPDLQGLGRPRGAARDRPAAQPGAALPRRHGRRQATQGPTAA